MSEMLVINRTTSNPRPIMQPTPSSIHLSSPARLKRRPPTLPPIRPFADSCSPASFTDPRIPQELDSRSVNAIISGRFNEVKVSSFLKPVRSFPNDMNPNVYRPLVQSSTGAEQPVSERFSYESVPRPLQLNDSDAQRQQQLFEYHQPALLFTGVPRLPPPSYPPPRSHPSLANYPAESHFHVHGRDVGGAASACLPPQNPGGIPLRVSDAINRPPPYALRNESLGPNFTITPAPPVAHAWPSPNYPLRPLDTPVQHSQHPSPSQLPLPVQNETPPHLPPLRPSEAAALFPSASAQPVSQPQGPADWPEPPPPSPNPTPRPTFSVVAPKGPRRPRREILADIKHLIFIWRADAPTSDTYRPRPPGGTSPHESPRTPAFISPAMDPPLLCTFRVVGTYPTIDSQLEQVREKEEGQEHGFPSQTLKHTPDPQLVGPDGIQWLVEPSRRFPTLRNVLPTAEERRARRLIKVEEDDIEVFIQQEVAAREFPTLPALSYGSSQSSVLPPLASLASPPSFTAPYTAAMGPPPQHLGHIHNSLLPMRAPPPAPSSFGTMFYPPRVSHPPPTSLRPSVADARRTVDVHFADQVHRPVQPRDRIRNVRPPPTSAPSSGPSDVLMSKNLMDVLLASVAAPPTKKYVCEVCSKAFERRASLETHMTVHSGQRPHKCPVPRCGRDFSVRSNYRRHLRTHELDPRQFDCDQRNPGPDSVLEAVMKSSGVLPRKRRAMQYSSSESELELDRGENVPVQLGQVGTVAVAAAGAGGSGEQPGGWAPPPSVGPMENDVPWIPESLRQFHNAHLLSDKPPFDLSRCGTTPSMPLPPVHPWGSPTEPSFEERNSYDSNVSETPYHPNQWLYRPRLPGPAVGYGQELSQYADRARSAILSHLS
ncbi:hypothetical protein FS837_000783 [Tulasnella sp. UAMH 9824]|nr:hypothetical protein FS837_000783 [Tulasnella sp. UAMH 9824]